MERDLREIMGEDQFTAERRDGRRLAVAIAEDVVSYHRTLSEGGLDGDLVSRLTEQFAQHWLGPVQGETQVIVGAFMEGDE